MVATSDVEKDAFFAVLRSYGIEEILMTSFRLDDIKSCSRYDDHHHQFLQVKKKFFQMLNVIKRKEEVVALDRVEI